MPKIINFLKNTWILLAFICSVMLFRKPILLILQYEKEPLWLGYTLLICLTLYYLVFKYVIPFKFRIKNIKNTSSQSIFPDLAIQDKSEDKLERQELIENLAKIIKTSDIGSPCYRICLQGKWGEGKTSVINLLKQNLKYQKDLVFLDADPWFYNDINSAQKGMLRNLANNISNQYPYNNANKEMEEYLYCLAGEVGQNIIGLKIPMSIEEDSLSIKKEKISEYITKTNKKFVVIFDDLDRLSMEDLKVIFKTIMSLESIKGLILILPIDIECVSKKIGSKDFLEKIFTIILPLPKISHTQYQSILEEYLIQTSPALKEDLDKPEFVFFTNLSKFTTIRNIKRFTNVFKMFYQALNVETNTLDLLCITYLYLFFNDVYEDIWHNRHIYMGFYKNGFMSLMSEKIDYKNYFETMLRKYGYQDQEDIISILSKIAPKFVYNDKHFYRGEDKKSITSSEHFDKYFLLKASSNDMLYKEIEYHIRIWQGAKDPKEEILMFIKENLNKLTIFFKKLQDITISRKLLEQIISIYADQIIFELGQTSYNIVKLLSSSIDNIEYNALKIKNKVFLEKLIAEGKNLDLLYYLSSFAQAGDLVVNLPEEFYFTKLLSDKIDNIPPLELLNIASFRLFSIYMSGFLIHKDGSIQNNKTQELLNKFFPLILSNIDFIYKFLLVRTILSSDQGALFDINYLVKMYGEKRIEQLITNLKQKFNELEPWQKKNFDDFLKAYKEYKTKVN